MKKINDKISHTDKIQRTLSDDKTLTSVVRKAVKEAVTEHKRLGNPIATLKNGKVVWIEAE